MSSLLSNELDLDSIVRKVGTHYIAIGDHADLWDGELINAASKTRSRVAIKLLRGGSINKPNFQDNLQRALESHGRIWKTFQSDHVARFHGLTFNCGIMPALILDFYPNGNINEFVKERSLDDERKLTLIKEIALGLRYLHQFQPSTIHGDLRGANVLIDANGHAVLVDYGLVFIIDSSDFTTTKVAGTCRWSAPELMGCDEGEYSDPPYSLASDIFAFAMTTIEVFTENPPFSDRKRDGAVLFAILRGKRPDLPAYIQERSNLASLIQSSWDQSPEARPSADEICKVLQEIT